MTDEIDVMRSVAKSKRYRAPVARPGELKAKWGTSEGLTAIQYAWGADGASKADARIPRANNGKTTC